MFCEALSQKHLQFPDLSVSLDMSFGTVLYLEERSRRLALYVAVPQVKSQEAIP